MDKMPLSLPHMSWPLIEVLAPLKSTVLSRMMFVDLYEANLDKVRRIMDVSFRIRHAFKVTNMPPKCIYPSL
jgi:hypothetical protein